MRYRFVGLILAFLCLPGLAPAAPEPRAALKLPLANGVVFLGLAGAGERVVAVGERGVVIYSDDAGRSWKQADVPVRATLTAVTFLDQRLGFAVGHDGVILKTADAGATWSLLNFAPDTQNVMLNVRFRNAHDGYVVGSNGQLSSTRDGGTTWQRQTLSVEDWYQNHIFDIAWAPGGSTLVVAEKGVLYRSAGGTDTYVQVESPYDGSYFGALALRDGRLLIYGMNGHAFASDDGSVAWQRIDTGTRQFLFAGAVLPDGSPLLVGGGGTMVRLDPVTLRASGHQLPERAGITAVLPRGDAVYLATEAGGVQRKVLADLFD
ncbi:MAG: WD40/YVTN/BNR-like repeat-containing protein [Immundisolibacter sp.]|uniref:WD40/YVTN/BNR-like repeat-containing protein n=1 Tax=Immundisolibacter sp. TaxID=1934948 RepID=UPI003EE18A68